MTSEPSGLSPAKQRVLNLMLKGEAEPLHRLELVASNEVGSLPPPISPEQRQVWLHASLAEDLPLYNEPITIHYRGSLDLTCLQGSFDAVLRRHDIWRSAFRPANGTLRQLVEPELRVALPFVDLSGIPEGEREIEALRLAADDARTPFDLAHVPLFRARVIKLAADYHRLYLTLHHIIFDGVSICGVFLPELVAEYEARVSGRPRKPESRSHPQYASYARWRQHSIESAGMPRQMAYWRTQLAGELPSLALPYDRARPARLSHRGSVELFTLPMDLTEAVRALARRKQVTIYMLLLAVFKVLLHRYSGLNDLIVGGAVDMRQRPELQGIMGYCLNSVALRSHPSETLTFAAYLEEVKGVVLDAIAASDVPFDQVVRELSLRRDASHHPLFDVLFSMQPPVPELTSGWDLTQGDVTVGTAKFDLFLELEERTTGIVGRLQYSTDLFEATTIRRMIRHWVRLLQSAVVEPETRLADLPLLSPDESHQLLFEWNDTARQFPRTTLPAWFEEQVRQTPDRIAVRFEELSLTYVELDRRAEGLAARLRATGIGREHLVGVSLERSLEMIVALLAVLKSGAAYLPIDPGLPSARIGLIVRDSRCSALLGRRALGLAELGVPVIHLDESIAPPVPPPTYPAPAEPGSLAYVLYTSGSTGQPKGVEVSHGSIVNLLRSMRQEIGFSSDDALLAVTALSFDIAALEIFLPLVSGGTVVLAGGDSIADPVRLSALIRESGCTVMQATPTFWRSLVDADWAGRPELRIICGGEALSRPLADALLARCGTLWNVYGPTETTVWSTLHRVGAHAGPVSIGRPIANTRVYVLDPRGLPVPIGVAGELHIAGAGLARGYRNQDALTRERFVTRPGAPEERVYRTGDVACWRADGTLEFLGRTDAQLKVRGFRIAPEEVEAALETHPEIAAAAVAPDSDRHGNQRLTAYLVPRRAGASEVKGLRRHVAEILPGYMVPSRYLVVSSLPTTPNGKLDRSRLAAMERAQPLARSDIPKSDHERRLAMIWRQVLDVPEVKPRDDFFELGGHSLLVADLLRRIEASFGVRLPMAAILQAPTLGRMASLISIQKPPRRRRSSASRHSLIWVNAAPVIRHLSKCLESDHPLISVAVTPDDFLTLGEAPSLSAIATLVVDAIRTVQPRGPYRLGGWCVDGILAFEAATQLMQQGAAVELLVMLHSANPVHFRRLGASSIQLSKIRYYLKKLSKLHGAARWSYAAARLRGAIEPATPWLREASILLDAALKYEPSAYPGPVLLLQPAERPTILDYGPGWAEVVTGPLSITECPGDHCTMLEPPQVEWMANRIREHLDSGIKRQRAARGSG